MPEEVKTRVREREPGMMNRYETMYAAVGEANARQMQNNLVVRDSDREWERNRQGYLKFYLGRELKVTDTPLQDWWVFVHDIERQSGRHRHQGGLVLFVLEGQGATWVNGELVEWEEGDCILLPLDPKGIEHQHFNRGDKPAKWLAFIYQPLFMDHLGTEITQTQISPDFAEGKSGG